MFNIGSIHRLVETCLILRVMCCRHTLGQKMNSREKMASKFRQHFIGSVHLVMKFKTDENEAKSTHE